MQKRYWNYRDDDSTFDLSGEKLGIIDPGRYRGFDFSVGTSSMTLKLDNELTGALKVSQAGVISPRIGLWVSRQGVVITEDSAHFLTISNGDPTYGRYDLIVGSHHYTATIGGSPALYAVIEGTPAAYPAPPALTNPAREVILGILYIPPGTTSLTADMYVQEPIPTFANDEAIAYLNKVQYFSAMHAHKGLAMDLGYGMFDFSSGSIILGGIPNTLGADTFSSSPDCDYYYVYGEISGGLFPAGFVTITTLQFGAPRNYFGGTPPKAGRKVVYSTADVVYRPGGNLRLPGDTDVYITGGTPVIFEQVTGNTDYGGSGSDYDWFMISGMETRNDSINKVRGLLSSYVEGVSSDGSYQITRSGINPRNVLKLIDTNAPGFPDMSVIQYISTQDYTRDGSGVEYGTELTIIPRDGCGLQILSYITGSPTPPGGYKPIVNPNGYHMNIAPGGSIRVVEMENFWVVTSVTGEFPYWVPLVSLVMDATGGYVCKMGGVVYFKGFVYKTAGAGTIPANSGYSFFGVPSKYDVYGNQIFKIPSYANKYNFLRKGYTLTFDPMQLDAGGAGGINIGSSLHPVMNSGTAYFIFLDGVSFTP